MKAETKKVVSKNVELVFTKDELKDRLKALGTKEAKKLLAYPSDAMFVFVYSSVVNGNRS